MPASQLSAIMRQLRQTALAATGGNLTDAELLDCYLERRDDDAFEALVRRHGAMVLGVCRRVLGNSHDAEDAFQATFLVLVRKAASIRGARLGNWLHGVACRTALKARTASRRRQARESRMAKKEAIPAGQPNDWQAVLDQELQHLPEKYRAAVVLCDLEGKTRKEAARQLGWTESTLGTRLARARRLLLARLTRRGVTLPLTALCAGLAQSSAAAFVPAVLVKATVQAHRVIALASAGAIPAKVALLMEGVLKSMAITKAKKLLAVSLVALTMFGLGMGGYQSLPAEASANENAPIAKPTDVVTVEKDLRLAVGPMPSQALISLEGGRVAVKMGVTNYQLRKEKAPANGVERYSYQPVTMIRTHHVEAGKVRVFDTQGQEIKSPKLVVLLKKEVLALVVDGADPDPLQLRLVKEGTLIFRLPLPAVTAAVEPPPPGYVLAPAPGTPGVVPVPEVAPAPPAPAENELPPEGPHVWGNNLFNAVGSTLHDFGTVTRAAKPVHRFYLRNIHKVPLEITSVRVSCGCLAWKQSARTIQPNETAFIEVTLDPRRFSGKRTMRIYVTFGNDYVSTATLTVEAVVRADEVPQAGTADKAGNQDRNRRKLPALTVEDLLDETTSVRPIQWLADFKGAVQEARRRKRPMLMWFYRAGESSSQKLETTWRDDYIRSVLNDEFVCLKFDPEHPDNRRLAERLKVEAWPTITLVQEGGRVREKATGYQDPAQLSELLHKFLRAARSDDYVWNKLGVGLVAVEADAVSAVNRQLHGGLKVTKVKDGSPADKAGIKTGDILVGLHQWEMLNLDNVAYTLAHPDLGSDPVSIYVVRSGSVRKAWVQLGSR